MNKTGVRVNFYHGYYCAAVAIVEAQISSLTSHYLSSLSPVFPLSLLVFSVSLFYFGNHFLCASLVLFPLFSCLYDCLLCTYCPPVPDPYSLLMCIYCSASPLLVVSLSVLRSITLPAYFLCLLISSCFSDIPSEFAPCFSSFV